MITDEIRKKIRTIEIQTKRLLSGTRVGDNHSSMKGSGIELDQIRDYESGDDVRAIDWSSSARSGKLIVKRYIEERSRSIILAIDASGSVSFGSESDRKWDVFKTIAAVLSIIAQYGKDNVGLLIFSDEIECFIPVQMGAGHTQHILETLFSFEPTKKRTSLSSVLKKIAEMKRRDAIVFLISDFIQHDMEAFLPCVAKMCDLIAISVIDNREKGFPCVGLLPVKDLETGETILLDTRGRKGAQLNEYLSVRAEQQRRFFRKYGVDYLELSDGSLLIANLVQFFRRRMRY